ncbi:hypothetical protein [Lentisalinibacter salinarum]|uniref:hypothetical protein n=1 Tax=Lentisalinibacter salinarum TaxID=2992239 RepID=UPI0038690494
MAGSLALGLLLVVAAPAAGSGAEEPLRGVVAVGETAAAAIGAMESTGDLAAVPTRSPDDLPTQPQDYAAVEALVIDGSALARLDTDRLRALLEYAGRCGPLILIGAPGDAEYVLARRAGCGGRFVAGADARSSTAVLERLTADGPPAMIDAEALRPLLPDANGEIELMAVFVAGFLGVFLVLLAVPGLRPAALGFCLLATAVAGVLWTGGRNDAFVAWAEVDRGDRIARYVSLGTAVATGRGEHRLPLGEFGGYPTRVIGTDYVLDEEANRIEWRATLLAQLSVESAGSFPAEPSLRAEIRDGTARVCNRSHRTVEGAWLAAADGVYAVPPLAPGEIWQAAGTAVSPGPATRLLRERAGGLAVLLRLAIPGDRIAQDAWLVRREIPSAEAAPCSG